MRDFWLPIATIAWKDLLLEFRTKDIVVSGIVFAIATVLVFNFALRPTSETIGFLAPGILWVAFTFTGTLGLNRSFILEKEQGGLDGLMLCPVSRDVLYFGKFLSSFLFMLAVQAAIFPIFSVLFNISLITPSLLIIAILATLGFASLGTLFSAISVNTRSREVLLPILFFPMVLPIVIGAVAATGLILDGTGGADIIQWIVLLGVFAATSVTISALLFSFTLGD